MNYLPWHVGSVFVCLVAVSRILTNYYIKARYQDILKAGLQSGLIPLWVSALYILGCSGLLVSGVWSFVIAWWAPALVVAAYFVQMLLIPSAMPKAIQHAADDRASAAIHVAVKELDGAIEQLRSAVQGGTSNPGVEAAVRQAMDAVEQAKPLIDALPDSKKKFGLLMFLQEHLERFQEAANGLGTSSQS